MRNEPLNMTPKSDTIEAIRELNTSASPDFLAEFSNEDLSRYLDRLTDSSGQSPVLANACAAEGEENFPVNP